MIQLWKTHWRFWGAPLLIGAGIILLAVIVFSNSPESATPVVAWTPSSVLEAVPAGQSVAVPVSLTAARNLTDVVVRVVPELQPFVEVDQPMLGDITEGETVVLTFMISVPGGALPETIEGVVQLRSGSTPKKTFASPLPFTILVLEPATINIGNPTVSPQEVFTDTPTDVIVRMTIAHPDVLSADVIQVDKSGQELGTLGILNDEGNDGDDVAGDGQYAGSILVNEPSPGQFLLLVEVAVDGAPLGTSGVATVDFVDSNTKRWPVVTHSDPAFEIHYPPSWSAKISDNADSEIQFLSTGRDFGALPDSYLPDASIFVIPNPEGLSVEDFFDGFRSPNYFADAASTENILVDGRPAKRFNGVKGLIGSDVVVIPLGTNFIEITSYSGGQIFDEILPTLEFL